MDPAAAEAWDRVEAGNGLDLFSLPDLVSDDWLNPGFASDFPDTCNAIGKVGKRALAADVSDDVLGAPCGSLDHSPGGHSTHGLYEELQLGSFQEYAPQPLRQVYSMNDLQTLQCSSPSMGSPQHWSPTQARRHYSVLAVPTLDSVPETGPHLGGPAPPAMFRAFALGPGHLQQQQQQQEQQQTGMLQAALQQSGCHAPPPQRYGSSTAAQASLAGYCAAAKRQDSLDALLDSVMPLGPDPAGPVSSPGLLQHLPPGQQQGLSNGSGAVSQRGPLGYAVCGSGGHCGNGVPHSGSSNNLSPHNHLNANSSHSSSTHHSAPLAGCGMLAAAPQQQQQMMSPRGGGGGDGNGGCGVEGHVEDRFFKVDGRLAPMDQGWTSVHPGVGVRAMAECWPHQQQLHHQQQQQQQQFMAPSPSAMTSLPNLQGMHTPFAVPTGSCNSFVREDSSGDGGLSADNSFGGPQAETTMLLPQAVVAGPPPPTGAASLMMPRLVPNLSRTCAATAGMRKSYSALELNAWRSPSFCGGLEGLESSEPGKAPPKLTPEERLHRILRYRQKRDARNFQRTIKYQCRKTLADTRPRVNGRFARNDEPGSVMPHETKKAQRERQAREKAVALAVAQQQQAAASKAGHVGHQTVSPVHATVSPVMTQAQQQQQLHLRGQLSDHSGQQQQQQQPTSATAATASMSSAYSSPAQVTFMDIVEPPGGGDGFDSMMAHTLLPLGCDSAGYFVKMEDELMSGSLGPG